MSVRLHHGSLWLIAAASWRATLKTVSLSGSTTEGSAMRLDPNGERPLRFFTFLLLTAAAFPTGRKRSREDERAILEVFHRGLENSPPSV